MTAIGFILIVLVIVFFKISDHLRDPWHTRLENLATMLGLLGIVLLIAGIAVWLWQVMP